MLPKLLVLLVLAAATAAVVVVVGSTKTTSTKTMIRVRSINGDADEFAPDELAENAARAASLVLVAPTSGGGEKPRLIPLVASDSGYSENSSVNILCTVSQGHHESLTFDWFKDGQSLSSSSAAATSDSSSSVQPQIENQPDHSLLRISRVKWQQAGRYTCSARNQFGQDSSSVNLAVNGNYC